MNLVNSTLPGEIPPPLPDPNASRCHLLGTTGLIVQFIMGLLVLASLVVKRQFEKRKRPWRIWVWDVSKQLAGQAVVHGLNVLISNVVADAADNNPCSLYFLNILIDTTVGVLIFYLTLKGLTWYLTEYLGKEGYVSGRYGSPPKPIFWWRQLVPYLMSMVFMKLLVVLPLTLPHISTALLRFGHAMLEYLSPQVQIVFVMALFPVIMNIIQFCIFDQIIKAGKAGEASQEEEDKEDEQDGTGGGGYRRLPTGDLEDGRGGSSSGSRSLSRGRDQGRRRGSRSSVKGIDSRSSTPIPRSPLLEPSSLGSKKDYGSTSPSPRLSGDGGSGSAGTFWQNMLSARSGGSGAVGPPSPQDSNRTGAPSSATATATRDDWRSGAPSPDSFRHDSDGPIPPIELSSNSDGASASPPVSMTSSGQFGHVSRLSEDLGREARKQLSPRSRTSMASVFDSAVGMKDLPS